MLTYDFAQQSFMCTDSEMRDFLGEVYRSQRHLEKAPVDALLHRLDGLVTNLIDVRWDGELSLIIKNGKIALSLVDLLEEFNIRGIDSAGPLQSCLERFEKHRERRISGELASRCRATCGCDCLVKYTKREYLGGLQDGITRLRLASSYRNEGYSIAICDDELAIDFYLLNGRIISRNGASAPIINDKVTRKAAGDYYVSCFSDSIEPKLFFMFEADACFVINDRARFVRRICEQYRAQYAAQTIAFGSVTYVDPYREFRVRRPMEFSKAWEFSYEREMRFVAFGQLGDMTEVREVRIALSADEYQVLTL